MLYFYDKKFIRFDHNNPVWSLQSLVNGMKVSLYIRLAIDIDVLLPVPSPQSSTRKHYLTKSPSATRLDSCSAAYTAISRTKKK
jgi:hypothetical protein